MAIIRKTTFFDERRSLLVFFFVFSLIDPCSFSSPAVGADDAGWVFVEPIEEQPIEEGREREETFVGARLGVNFNNLNDRYAEAERWMHEGRLIAAFWTPEEGIFPGEWVKLRPRNPDAESWRYYALFKWPVGSISASTGCPKRRFPGALVWTSLLAMTRAYYAREKRHYGEHLDLHTLQQIDAIEAMFERIPERIRFGAKKVLLVLALFVDDEKTNRLIQPLKCVDLAAKVDDGPHYELEAESGEHTLRLSVPSADAIKLLVDCPNGILAEKLSL